MNFVASWFGLGTLRQQLLRWVLVPMVILLLLNIMFAYRFGNANADLMHDQSLFDMSKVLRDQMRTNQAGEVELNIHTFALDMLSEGKKDKLYYFIRGLRNEYQFGRPDLPLPPEKLSESPTYYLAHYDGKMIRMMAAIMPEPDVADGRLIVIVGKTLVQHDERAREWIWGVLPSQLSLILFAGIMVWWGVGRGLRPLLQLSDEVRNRSSQDLSPLPEQRVVAEVRPLIHSINQLMERLDESLVRQRRFIDDAAHQLRTPLTGLKAQAELALHLSDPAEIRHSLRQIHMASDHAAHLANQLLVLARSEPGVQNNRSMVRLDLRDLARDITVKWAQNAAHKHKDIGFEHDNHECYISGDRLLLGELLNNLIDNALRYTQADGLVTVRVGCGDAEVSLEVEDNGPGIPENDRERVFERFYRVLGTSQEGCGLGLSIVHEIAHRHDAEVRLLSGCNGIGTLVRVVFRSA
ncbi:MAG: sensor histidine kinase N-terminal domain-containing protein [Nitrosomonadales bacterium]|nr:sensor histidine kinase N-terminal domain-containing protein [Nitrosomonadales bacterium]